MMLYYLQLFSQELLNLMLFLKTYGMIIGSTEKDLVVWLQ